MSKRSVVALAALLTTAINAGAETALLQPDDAWPSLTISDQFDKPFVINEEAELLLFSASMTATKRVTEALLATESTCYDSAAVRYVADISGMPSFIAKTMALPKMRKRPFKIGLIRHEEDGVMIPRREDQVTLITLKQGAIKTVSFSDDEMAVKQALATVCAAP